MHGLNSQIQECAKDLRQVPEQEHHALVLEKGDADQSWLEVNVQRRYEGQVKLKLEKVSLNCLRARRVCDSP